MFSEGDILLISFAVGLLCILSNSNDGHSNISFFDLFAIQSIYVDSNIKIITPIKNSIISGS